MKINNARIVLTGACGGIGQAIATELAQRGAQLLLVDFHVQKLETLVKELTASGAKIDSICADLSDSNAYQAVINKAVQYLGQVDMLINGAGIMSFTEFHDDDPEILDRTFRINVIAPMQLTRLLLPDMLERKQGHIVNVGSVFGSIGFACFTTYSSTKFALRGFSESLRRELDGSGIKVTYAAPRAVKTPLNSPAVYRMAQKVKMNMDEPVLVARKIVRAIEKDKKDLYIGFPESLFVRINGIIPRIVDLALRKQNQVMHEFTHEI
jgi:short-subunit dehydrogenase